MKGRFRKGKKAFSMGKSNRVATRYAIWLLRIENRKRQAMKIAMAALAQGFGVARLAVIRTQNAIDPLTRSLLMVQSAVDTAKSIQKIMA